MKGITPIIGIIILLLITMALIGSAYTFLSGLFGSFTAKTIKIVPGSINDNTLIIQNFGTETIQPGDLRIEVSGRPAEIINPPTIPPRQSALIEFKSPLGGDNINIRVIGPTNPQTFRSDIKTVTIYPDKINLSGASFCQASSSLVISSGHRFQASTDFSGVAGSDYGGIFNWTLLDGSVPTTSTIQSVTLSIYYNDTLVDCINLNTSYFYQVDNVTDCSNFHNLTQNGVEDPINGSGPADAKAQVEPPFSDFADCVSAEGKYKTFTITGSEAEALIPKGITDIYFDMHGEDVDALEMLVWRGNHTTTPASLEITYKLP